MSRWPSNKESSKQSVKSQQKLIQDSNYVNQIFFGILSTLESIVLFYQNKLNSQSYNNKMFSHYDRVDYRTKSLQELKSQLNSQLYVFLVSRRVFVEQFPQEKWKPPHNFDERKTEQILSYSINLFQHHHDEQSLQMVNDIGKIMRGDLDNIYSEKNKIKVQYSESQRQQFKGQSFKHGIHAQGELDKRAKEVENVKEVSDLKAKINERNQTFGTQHQPMDAQENSKQCYLVFNTHMTKEKLEKKFYKDPFLTKYKSSAECKFFGTEKELLYYQKQLISNGYIYAVCIYVNKYDKIEAIKAIQALSKDETNGSQDNAQSQLSYIIFWSQSEITILAGNPLQISYIESHCECKYVKDKEELKKQKKLLNLHQKLYIVPVRLNKDRQVIYYQDYKKITKESQLNNLIGQSPEKDEKNKTFYVILSKMYIHPNKLEKHKRRRFNLQDFADTVQSNVKLCRSKDQIEEQLKKWYSPPIVLKFIEVDDFVAEINEAVLAQKYDSKAGRCIYILNQ